MSNFYTTLAVPNPTFDLFVRIPCLNNLRHIVQQKQRW